MENTTETTNKKILVNWMDLMSIEKAEKLKLKYENDGYKLLKTERINLMEDILIFEVKK